MIRILRLKICSQPALTPSMTTVWAAMLVACILAGCDSLDFEKSKPKLAGERIAIMPPVVQSKNFGESGDDHASATPVAMVALPAAVANNEWPQSGCNPQHAPGNLQLAMAPKPVWSARVGTGESADQQITSSPIAAEGKIFSLDSRLMVSAVDSTDGRVVWKQSAAPATARSGVLGGGVAYDQGKLYIATPHAEVLCLQADTGHLLWRAPVRNPVRSAPTVKDGRIFVITIGNELEVLSTADGQLLWSHAGLIEPAGLLLGYNSPVVYGETLLVAYSSGEVMTSRIENGFSMWETNVAAHHRSDPMASLSHIVAHPVLDQGLVFVTTYSGRTVALDFRSGKVVWEHKLSSIYPVAVSGAYVFVLTTANQLVCLGHRDGRVHWSKKLNEIEAHQDKEKVLKSGLPVWMGPLVAGNQLIVVADNGEIRWLSAVDGTTESSVKVPDTLSVLPIIAQETLYVLSDRAHLHAFR